MSDSAVTRQRAESDGRTIEVLVRAEGIDVDGRLISWLDVDDLIEGDHALTLVLADSTSVVLGKLGASHDGFVSEVRAARRRVRFPALTVADGEPNVSFVARDPAGSRDVHLFDDVLVVEPRTGAPLAVPFGLVDSIERDGPSISIEGRGLRPLVVRGLGRSADEFEDRLRRGTADVRARVAAAYREVDPVLEGCSSPNGRACRADHFGTRWSSLLDVIGRSERAAEFALLRDLPTADPAIGVFVEAGSPSLLFALVTVGERAVVEGLGSDDRATFVFEGVAADDLSALLTIVRFRREVLALDEERLGRWAVAVRANEAARTLRSATVGRVVHGPNWSDDIRRLVGR